MFFFQNYDAIHRADDTQQILTLTEIASFKDAMLNGQEIAELDARNKTARSKFATTFWTSLRQTSFGKGSQSLPNLSEGQKKLRKRHEKTVVILILIVVVFLICHSFRLGVQTFQVKKSFILKITFFVG